MFYILVLLDLCVTILNVWYLQLNKKLETQGRVWQYGRDGAVPLPSSLSCPVTSLRLHSGESSITKWSLMFCKCSQIKIHKGVLLVSGYSGCLAWPARDLKTNFGAQPELVGCTIQHYPMKLYLADISLTPSFSHQLAKVAYSVPATASLHVSACLLTRWFRRQIWKCCSSWILFQLWRWKNSSSPLFSTPPPSQIPTLPQRRTWRAGSSRKRGSREGGNYRHYCRLISSSIETAMLSR